MQRAVFEVTAVYGIVGLSLSPIRRPTDGDFRHFVRVLKLQLHEARA